MRFENDELSELCRAYPPGFIVGVDVTAAMTVDEDGPPTAGDAGGGSGEYDGVGRASRPHTVTAGGRLRTQLAGDRCGGGGCESCRPRHDPYGS